MGVVRLASGEVFAGYLVHGVAGRGGMGIVYRATELALDRPVALKVIAPGLADDPRFRDRFVRECRLAAALDHPNIVPVYQAGEHEGVLYLVTRFVEGEDLLRVIRNEHVLPARRAAPIIGQVAAALDAAHARGLVHRDVKPANVLVTPGDHAYLADFGLSKRLQSVVPGTKPGGWVGTLDYVAPEQIRGERLDGRADVYALGCVLFHALAGRVPFDRQDDEAKLWAHLHDPPPAPSELAPGIAPALDHAVARAMAKSPDDRYPTAGGFGRAAVAAGHGKSIEDAEPTVAIRPSMRIEGTTAERSRAGGGGGRPTRWLWLAAGGLAAAGAVAAIEVATTGSSSHAGTPPQPVRKPVDTRLPPITDVGYRPEGLAAADGNVWVASRRPTLTRIDARTGRISLRWRGVPGGASAVQVAYGAVWVTSPVNRTLTVLDPRTGRVRGRPIPIGSGKPVGLAAAEGAVWVISDSPAGDSVTRVDARSRRVVRVIRGFGGGLSGVAAGVAKGIWVVNRRRGIAQMIDARTNRVAATIRVGSQPRGVTVGAGAIWVPLLCQGRVAICGFQPVHGMSAGAPTARVLVGRSGGAGGVGAVV